MSSRLPNGSSSRQRKGKRSLEEGEPDEMPEEPAPKRFAVEKKEKLLEEEEEGEAIEEKSLFGKKASNSAMMVDESHQLAINRGLASSSMEPNGGGVVPVAGKAKIAKRSGIRQKKPLQAPVYAEHWIFDEKSVPHDVLEWVLGWFTRQESCVLRTVCHKWSELVGLRVYRQATFLDQANALLRIPSSRFLGERDFPWAKSRLAPQIEALNLAQNGFEGVIVDAPKATFALLKPFANLKHLAVRGSTGLLDLIADAKLNLDSLTIFAKDPVSVLPETTKKTLKFAATRLQLCEYSAVSLGALKRLLAHFPALRYLALHMVGLEAPKATVEWIATEYKPVLESLLIDLVPYQTTPESQYVTLYNLKQLIDMPHLRVLSVYGNDKYRTPDETQLPVFPDMENAVLYKSTSLECLSFEAVSAVRTPITLDMPQLAELNCRNIHYLNASDCPSLETISLDASFASVQDFFKKHSGLMLQSLQLQCGSRPPHLSEQTKLELTLPKLKSLEFDLGHDQITSLTLHAPNLTDIKMSTHLQEPQVTIQAPNLQELFISCPASLLVKLDQQLASWPLLRKKVLVNHDVFSPHMLGNPVYRPLDSALQLLPQTHSSLSTISVTSNHRTLGSYLGYRNLRELNLRNVIYEDDLRSILSAASHLPHLMRLDIFSSDVPRLDNETTLPLVVNLPSIQSLQMELHHIPQLKFEKNSQRYLTTIALKLLEGSGQKSMIQKLDWIKQLPSLECLKLDRLKIPTTVSIQSATMRVLQLVNVHSHQAPNLKLDCPNVRVLNFQFGRASLKSLQAHLPALEKLLLSSDLGIWETEIWSQVDAQRRRNTEIIPSSFQPHWMRSTAARNRLRGDFGNDMQMLFNMFGADILPLMLMGQAHQQHHRHHHDDDDDDDDEDDEYDEHHPGPCPHCGRIHAHHDDHDDHDASDEEDDSNDDDEGEFCQNCGVIHYRDDPPRREEDSDDEFLEEMAMARARYGPWYDAIALAEESDESDE